MATLFTSDRSLFLMNRINMTFPVTLIGEWFVTMETFESFLFFMNTFDMPAKVTREGKMSWTKLTDV